MSRAQEIKLDRLTRRFTGYTTFAEFVDLCINASDPNYVPTLIPNLLGVGADKLADAFDAEMARRGDPRRCWRGSKHTA